MAIILVILVAAIIAVVVIGYALGLFRIEKVEIKPQDNSIDFPQDGEGEDEAPDKYDLDDGLSLKEKMAMNGTLEVPREDTSAEDDAAPGEPDGEKTVPAGNGELSAARMEERFSSTDRLSDFKIGDAYLGDCRKLLAKAKEKNEIYAAAHFDFNRFRFINNLRGMSIGDYVLTKLSQDMPAVFPDGTVFTRISADHFAAVFPVADLGMFEDLAQQLVEVCERLRADVGLKSGLRMCIGFAFTNNPDRDYDVSILLHKANIARQSIKTSRNEVWKLFEEEMITTWLYGESAQEDYSENQYDDEFVIYFAPQQTGKKQLMSGSEVMVRWACEDSPSRSFAGGKYNIPTNTAKVIYQTCRSMSRWRKAGKQVLPVSVSIPVTEFLKSDLDELLKRCLSEFQLDPSEFAIVVAASIVRIDWSAASRQMKKLHQAGVKIGVDEVHTGYANLEFMAELPIDFIKLNRSFAADVDTDVEKQGLVRMMLQHAKAQSLRVICEGVDTAEQMSALESIGVQEYQGKACGVPQDAEEFMRSLLSRVETSMSAATVILDDKALSKGEYEI